MKAVIVYDSFFGNTKDIAFAITSAFKNKFEPTTIHAKELSWNTISGYDILIVGSPTRGFRPSEHIKTFLKNIPKKALGNFQVAAFDTRLALSSIESKSLQFIVKTGGFAAGHIAKQLQKKGGKLVLSHEGFFVTGEKGPLADGETKRAKIWGEKFIEKLNTK